MKKALSAIMLLTLVLTGICVFTVNAAAMNISVSLVYDNDRTITLDVEPTDRIEDIKDKIYDETGKSPDKQVLIFADKSLEDGNTLQDYSIQKDSVIQVKLVPCADNAHVWTSETYFAEDVCGECGLKRNDILMTFTLDIDFGGETFEHTFKAEPTDTVLTLKNMIAQELGISADAQELLFGETVLDDSKTLWEYSLSDGDTLKLRSVCDGVGHVWREATCTTAKTCAVCGDTEGETAGHVWNAATCTLPKTCSSCGATEGSSAGHKYTSADCISPKICTVCEAISGEALGHAYDGDCDGECNRCGAERQSAICIDYNDDRVCDVCGRETELEDSLVGIVGAVVIGVAVLAISAVVVVFAVKKKK